MQNAQMHHMGMHQLMLQATAKMGRVKRIWYLSPMRAAKVQASLRIFFFFFFSFFGFVMRRLSSLLLVKTSSVDTVVVRKQCLMNIKTDAVALKSPS